MEIIITGLTGVVFYYEIEETGKLHGLYNSYNNCIGYWYQDKKKGFWLWK